MRTCLFLFSFLPVHFCSAQVFYVKFPDDTLIVNYCDPGNPSTTGLPEFYNPDSLPLAAEYFDEIFGITPVCFTITRNWTVYNAANYDPAGSLIQVPNPAPLSFSNFATNQEGPVVSPIDDPDDPWSATIQKIHPGDTVLTNFSMFWDSLANGYIYKQIIHILDTLPPAILSCASDTLAFFDTTDNDTLFWNEPYWSEPGLPWHDLRESPVDLSVTAFDSCSGTSIGAQYLLFLDLDQDGIQETVVPSGYNYPPGTVRFNNLNTPNYSGGTPRVFDERPVPANEKFVFDEEHAILSDKVVFTMRWRKSSWPYTYSTPQLPPGTHKIRWTVSDGCGQASTCEYAFVIAGPVSGTNNPAGLAGIQLFPPEPNPFEDQTAIRFYLPESAPIHFEVLDVTGRRLFENIAELPAGEHRFNLTKEQLGGISGLLICRLECNGRVLTQKLVTQ